MNISENIERRLKLFWLFKSSEIVSLNYEAVSEQGNQKFVKTLIIFKTYQSERILNAIYK